MSNGNYDIKKHNEWTQLKEPEAFLSKYRSETYQQSYSTDAQHREYQQSSAANMKGGKRFR